MSRMKSGVGEGVGVGLDDGPGRGEAVELGLGEGKGVCEGLGTAVGDCEATLADASGKVMVSAGGGFTARQPDVNQSRMRQTHRIDRS